ncbi:hypothetical protein F4811DRAFT_524080 [Daldinia bambusicola]|nr:hypothetical protein F4811DRAFT_524080 [Daldinia bambusicola]
MKTAGRRLDKSAFTDHIVQLFNTATDMVHPCQSGKGGRFWKLVSHRVKWARHISPGNLYDLSIRIISASSIFLDRVSFWAEMKREENWDVPDSYFVRDFNEVNTAVDSFTKTIYDTYGANPNVREVFYPKWTDDSDNEGTAEGTKARFLQRCAEPRTHSTNATAGDRANFQGEEYEGYEDEDEEMDEGGEEEETYEGDEEYERNEGEGDGEEDDDEMGEDMDGGLDYEIDKEMGEVNKMADGVNQEIKIPEVGPSRTMTLSFRSR